MLFSLLLSGASLAAAKSCSPSAKPFTNFVTFGDSYTDNGRLGYYVNNGGKPPSGGAYQTTSNVTATGGLAWGEYVAQYTGVNYRDYGISGATCSNEIISRIFSSIKAPFPSVIDDEIPSFKTDVAFKSLYPDRTAENTVYALWIGTNDLGWEGFLSDSEAPGTTITDYVDCVWSVYDAIYQTGGRRFVLFNLAPLDLAPLYALQSQGGTGDSQFWTNKTAYNATEYNQKMREYTTTVNTVFDYGVPFNALVKARWPGASFDIFNVHQLLVDIYNAPAKYLAPPAISKGFFHHCNPANSSSCQDQTSLGPLDGFMWYDELHPSNKTSSIIAQNFLEVLAGNTTYGTHYGA